MLGLVCVVVSFCRDLFCLRKIWMRLVCDDLRSWFEICVVIDCGFVEVWEMMVRLCYRSVMLW